MADGPPWISSTVGCFALVVLYEFGEEGGMTQYWISVPSGWVIVCSSGCEIFRSATQGLRSCNWRALVPLESIVIKRMG